MPDQNGAGAQPDGGLGLDEILLDVARETGLLADQCTALQQSLSAILEVAHHPDLGAEIHMLQDIDRIQQTLSDLARIVQVAGDHARAIPVDRAEVTAAIRLHSLRGRLGLAEDETTGPGPAIAADASDVTWL